MSVMSNDDANTIASSIKSENLREVWRILDENENSSILKSKDFMNDQLVDGKHFLDDAITITSYRSPDVNSDSAAAKPNVASKSSAMNKKAMIITSKSLRSAKPSPATSRADSIKNQKPKIRNYNIKD